MIGEWSFLTSRDFDRYGLEKLMEPSPGQAASAQSPRQSLAQSIRQLHQHLKSPGSQFAYDRDDPESKLPRHNVWRPFALIAGGRLLAFVVLRNNKEFGCIEVDACMAADSPSLERDEAWRALAMLILTEACKRCPSMVVRFTKASGAIVPEGLRRLAKSVAVALRLADRGLIGPDEGAALYWRLTRMSAPCRDACELRAQPGRFSLERVAFLIHSAIWTTSEIEATLKWCPAPEWLLGVQDAGRSLLMDEAAHQYGLHVLLSGVLEAALQKQLVTQIDERSFHLAGGAPVRPNSQCRAHVFVRDYEGEPGDLEPLHWEILGPKDSIRNARRLAVTIRARDRFAIADKLADDLVAAASAVTQTDSLPALLVPADARYVAADVRNSALERAATRCLLLIAPSSLAMLGLELESRLERTRWARA